ncbi:MAG: ribonuclease H-like domain-containing protein, partial [Vulcanimicrobiota bacterium]
HFDISFAAKKLGLGKDLKMIEKNLNITREEPIADITGYQAVKLWEDKMNGNQESFELLKKHNESDVRNLQKIADQVFEMLEEKTKQR